MRYNDDATKFSPITSTDHAGGLWIMTIVGLSYSWCAALIRIKIKWGMFGLDDVFFGLAMIFLTTQSAVLFLSLENGMAKSSSITEPWQWRASGEALLQSEILGALTVCLMECSVAWLILRVFVVDKGRTWLLGHALFLCTILWGIGSIAGLAAARNSSTLLVAKSEDTCSGQILRWKVITTIFVLIHFSLCLLPALKVLPLAMPVAQKLHVCIVFACGLPMIPLCIYHLGCLQELCASNDPQLDVTDTLVLQQTMVTWSAMSAIIPTSRGFLNSFSSNFGTWNGVGDTVTTQTGPEPQGAQAGIELQTIGSRPIKKKRKSLDTDALLSLTTLFRGDDVGYEALVEATGPKRDVAATDEEKGLSGLSATGSTGVYFRALDRRF